MGCASAKPQASRPAAMGDPSKTLLVSRAQHQRREAQKEASVGVDVVPEVAHDMVVDAVGASDTMALTDDRAAIRLQAAWRGTLARREAALLRQRDVLDADAVFGTPPAKASRSRSTPPKGGSDWTCDASEGTRLMKSERFADDDTAIVPNDAASSGAMGTTEIFAMRGRGLAAQCPGISESVRWPCHVVVGTSKAADRKQSHHSETSNGLFVKWCGPEVADD
mmetsp:Transcript_13131/g.29991  ORF Transcript_13131/g.29991 Transcript_13131/m.29991 type:complete len:223 (-) Transcript_13131:62-730(-)